MRNKLLAVSGVAGLGTALGAISGGILGALGGLGVTVLFFIYTILPWAHDQVQNAPEWYWVAIVMGLVPTAIVLIVALLIGVIIGALIFGLIALLMTGGLAAVVAQAKKS
jgi:hypothetical protein